MLTKPIKFPFGKYKGTAICNVPKAYLLWAHQNMMALTDDQRDAIGQLLNQYEAMEKPKKGSET